MARSTVKSKKPTTPTTPSGGGIMSFFNKTPAAGNCNSRDSIVKVESKPALSSPLRAALRVNVTANRKGKGNGKGKEKERQKEKACDGSSVDPVIISDDEITLISPPRPKAPTTRRSETPKPAKRPKLSSTSSPTPTSTSESTVFPEAGPSRSPFAGFPEFRPPDTWPQIVNTARARAPTSSRYEVDEDGDPIPPSDEDDFELRDDEDGGDEDPMEDDADLNIERGLELEEEEQPDVVLQQHDEVVADNGGDVDLTMDWEEPEDEGMGMEEDGDDEASQVGGTRRSAYGRSNGQSNGKRKSVEEKVRACPVCGKSMKGKVDKLVQAHINACLDTPSHSASTKRTRPISSFSFSTSEPSPPPEPETPTKGPNAFSVLMSGHKEKEQWKDAEADLKRDGKRFIGRRKAPFYKVLTGMPVAVDAFRYGAVPKVTAYLLTHAHSDHYTNLSKSWNHGPIYCSETTANLIIHMLGVEPQWVHGLPDNIPFEMPNTGGVTVTPLEANHCPGSSIFLFEGLQTVNAGDSGFKSPYVGSKRVFRYLHCGDFRACPKMVLHPAIARARIDTCYLDTTYLNPKYCFPPQPQVIEACASLARQTVVGISATAPSVEDVKPRINVKLEDGQEVKPHLSEMEDRSKAMMQGWLVKDEVKEELREVGDEKPKGRTLVVMGTYSIGKERIVKAVAKALGSKIYCDPRKKGILLCQTDPELHALLSSDPVECQVHLLPLGNIQLDRMQPYLARLHPHFDRVLAFRPTGWTYTPPAGTDMLPDVNAVIKRDQARWFSERDLKPMRGSCRTFQMFGVPYSEHSSFFELTCFALSLPGPDLKMIATVNVGNEKSRAKMKKWFEKWLAEKARRKEKNLPAIVDYRDENYW